MDMSKNSNPLWLESGRAFDPCWKLKKHTKAIRENQLSVAVMILAMEGIPVDLTKRGEPMAEFAKECLDELEMDAQIGVWSCSTRAGGIWTTAQRNMLKYGE